MNINAIYPAFDGEQNKYGIGAPTIFVRAQGCHLRCYYETKGCLCDTPEALELKQSNDGKYWMSIDAIMNDLNNIRHTSGISKVTFSGGDPLARPARELHEFFTALQHERFMCTVETSGTISILPYLQYVGVSWVLDYKLKSCGIPGTSVDKIYTSLPSLTWDDYVKFVVEDWSDYEEFKSVFANMQRINSNTNYVVGLYWGSSIKNLDLWEKLVSDGIAGSIKLNIQAHKLIINPDFKTKIPERI